MWCATFYRVVRESLTEPATSEGSGDVSRADSEEECRRKDQWGGNLLGVSRATVKRPARLEQSSGGQGGSRWVRARGELEPGMLMERCGMFLSCKALEGLSRMI